MGRGRALTRTMRFERRQHELFGVDLGEGAPRGLLGFAGLVFGAWWVLMLAVIGWPTAQNSLAWTMPPLLVVVWGWRPGRYHPRRRRVTEWLLAWRWVRLGHQPVIALGRREPTAGEVLSLRSRVDYRLNRGGAKAALMPWTRREGLVLHEAPVHDVELIEADPAPIVLDDEVWVMDVETTRALLPQQREA